MFDCPFCRCVFCTRYDLTLHLKAFIVKPAPVNCPAVNVADHRRMRGVAHRWVEGGNFV